MSSVARTGFPVYEQSNSHAIFERAKKVIPGVAIVGVDVCPAGLYGHCAMHASAPQSPVYFSRAAGSRFWDVDGNEYIDYMCAYGPMVLGYRHPAVERAVREQNEKSNTVTLAAPVMVELAEYLVDLVPAADWAYFSKNGTDATNQAVMVARAATGRKRIVAIETGYHGVAQWMRDPGSPGITVEDTENVVRIGWNNLAAFEQAIAQFPGDIAAYIASPWHAPAFADSELPEAGYWKGVERLCRKHGIVLILDDVRSGFRLHMRGSCEYYGFRPDLICFGKALANGEPIAALAGSDALRDAVKHVFFTGTQFFNASPMAAALATLQELQRIDAPGYMLDFGRKLTDGLVGVAESHGFSLKATGMPSMPYLRLTDEDCPAWTGGLEVMHTGLHASWIAACTARGAYLSSFHNNFVSTAHTEADLERTLEIADEAFRVVKRDGR